MAAAIFRWMIQQEQPERAWQIESAGTWAHPGLQIPLSIFELLVERGLDVSSHRSRQVTSELISKFSLILTMEPGQKEALQIEFPTYAARIYTLGEMSGYQGSVADPVEGGKEEFQRTAAQIEHLLVRGKDRIFELAEKYSNLSK